MHNLDRYDPDPWSLTSEGDVADWLWWLQSEQGGHLGFDETLPGSKYVNLDTGARTMDDYTAARYDDALDEARSIVPDLSALALETLP
jgi:hypothetical protein